MTVKKELLKTKKYIFMQVLLTFIATIAIAFVPAYNKYLVDALITDREFHFSGLIMFYCLSFLIYLAASWGSERFVWKGALSFENRLKKKCFEKLVAMDYKDYTKKGHGEYLSMLTNQVTQIEQDYLTPWVGLIKAMLSVLIYTFVIAYHTNWLICLILLFLSILSGISPKIYQHKLSRAGKEFMEEAADYTKNMTDILEGFDLIDGKSIKGFQNRNCKITDDLTNKRKKFGYAKVNGNIISGMTVCLIDILIFILCGFLFQKGYITIGVIVAALTYAQSFTEPVEEILYDINMINSTKEVVKTLEDFFIYQPVPIKAATPKKLIKVSNVTVKYPNKVLNYDVTFEMNKKYILSGMSGSGKSTLLSILADRVNYEGGLIIDNEESKVDKNTFFYLSQDQHVFLDDFEQNVTLFHSYELNKDNMDKQMSHIDLYKQVRQTTNGTLLSGGEQQLLKMCRVWVQGKKILLLDEPFSAMDKDTKKRMIRLLNKSNAMIILITHDYCKEDYEEWEEWEERVLSETQ